jgi:hypothetical protein
MACGRACLCSAKCSDFRIKNLNPDAFLPHKDKLDLIYDGKRLKWNKNFEDLKYFLETVVGKSNITITWYYGKQKNTPSPGKGRVFVERLFNKSL